MDVATRRSALTTTIVVGAAIVSVLFIALNTIRSPNELSWNSWAFYEWLINYQGGFVRRGAIGELIHKYFHEREIVAVNWLVFALGASYVILSGLQALKLRRLGLAAVLHVFAPTGFFLAAVSNEYFFRKEMLFYVAIMLAAGLYYISTKFQTKIGFWVTLAFVFLCSIILPFVHEAALFYCTLFFSLLIYYLVRARSGEVWAHRVVSIFVILNLILFVYLSMFKGSAFQSEAIWQSLSPNARSFAHDAGPAGGISAIGWSVQYAMAVSLQSTLSGVGTYYLFPLLLIYLIIGYFYSQVTGSGWRSVYTEPVFFTNFIIVCASFAPLLLVSWDWGRLIFGIYVAFSTMVFFGLLFPVKVDAVNWLFRRQLKVVLLGLLLGISILTRTPECCLQGTGGSLLSNKVVPPILNRLFGPEPVGILVHP